MARRFPGEQPFSASAPGPDNHVVRVIDRCGLTLRPATVLLRLTACRQYCSAARHAGHGPLPHSPSSPLSESSPPNRVLIACIAAIAVLGADTTVLAGVEPDTSAPLESEFDSLDEEVVALALDQAATQVDNASEESRAESLDEGDFVGTPVGDDEALLSMVEMPVEQGTKNLQRSMSTRADLAYGVSAAAACAILTASGVGGFVCGAVYVVGMYYFRRQIDQAVAGRRCFTISSPPRTPFGSVSRTNSRCKP